jgi:hypothetical protein
MSRATYLVGFTSEKQRTISNAQSSFLLLALLVDLGDRPSLDVVGAELVGLNTDRWVFVGPGRAWGRLGGDEG